MTEQFIRISTFGDKSYYKDKKMEVLHREDGPAFEGFTGYKAWWLNGKRHREGGPAVEYSTGTKEWYLNGKLHRTDGPAFESYNGYKVWSVNGKELTEAQFNAQYGPKKMKKPSCEGKTVEVDGVKYKLMKA